MMNRKRHGALLAIASASPQRSVRPVKETNTMPDRRYAINVARREQRFFEEVTETGRKISDTLPDVEIVLGGPMDADANRQIEELEALIARKVSGIILFPANSENLAPTVNRAAARGIPVITLFSDVKDCRRLTLIGGPERESAREIARRTFQEHREFEVGPTKVLVSSNRPGESVTDERLDGIDDVLKEYKNVQILPFVNDEGDSKKGAAAIGSVLQDNPDIRVIFGLNARSAIGAVAALMEGRDHNGKAYHAGDVVVTGWDNDDDVLDAIEGGWIESTSVLHSSLCTQIAFGLLDASSLGYLYPDNLQLREFAFPAVPDKILIPETLVDRKSVNGYRRKKNVFSVARKIGSVKPGRRSAAAEDSQSTIAKEKRP